MRYVFPQKVLFKHCDPAGIVFYPRYFEIINDCVEAFFEDVVGLPFSQLHQTGGVPTAEITARFPAPSRIGDALRIELAVARLGRSSMGLALRADCDGAPRFDAASTLVLVSADGRPRAWPDAVRQNITPYLESEQDET